jgi:hypothetical protein
MSVLPSSFPTTWVHLSLSPSLRLPHYQEGHVLVYFALILTGGSILARRSSGLTVVAILLMSQLAVDAVGSLPPPRLGASPAAVSSLGAS